MKNYKTHSKENARLLEHACHTNLHRSNPSGIHQSMNRPGQCTELGLRGCKTYLKPSKIGIISVEVISTFPLSDQHINIGSLILLYPIELRRFCIGFSESQAHQISGATKLRHWKLIRRSSTLRGSVEAIPATRRINAVRRSESVSTDTICQKPSARHETNSSNL